MLILTRRVGETLMVGDEVTVTVLGVKGNQVRIGVNAPKEYKVNPTCSRKKIACKASALLAFDLCCWVFMAAASCLLC